MGRGRPVGRQSRSASCEAVVGGGQADGPHWFDPAIRPGQPAIRRVDRRGHRATRDSRFLSGASASGPSSSRVRASPAPIGVRPPGFATINAFLSTVAESLARQPWSIAFGGVLHDVTLVCDRDSWWARDHDGQALPVAGQNHWKAMVLTGGYPFDLTGEWDGHGLRALGVYVGGQYGGL